MKVYFIEKLYRLKRKAIKMYKKYCTVEHPDTYILSDKSFIKKLYKKRMGKEINLSNPKTFTEKQNWLKLYDRRPIYTVMVDKYLVRDFVAERIGEEYLVPLLGVWNNADEIDFEDLPDKYVLKCNHNSDVIICKNKVFTSKDGSNLAENEVRERLNSQLKMDYYKGKREWPYKNVPRKIICEEFMENTNNEKLVDYKLFCFNSEVVFVMVNSCQFEECGVHVDMYDRDWNYLRMQDGHYPNIGDTFTKPGCFDEMCKIAKVLSEGIPFLRVDLIIGTENCILES